MTRKLEKVLAKQKEGEIMSLMNNKLAISGGKAVRTREFPAWPQYDNSENKALIDILESGQWWRMANNAVEVFEKEFADYHNASSALAVSNGTHALEVALKTYGIGAGDEVIIPAFTFVSTALCVQNVGAKPILVDVDADTFNISPEKILAAITPKTKAIIPVHMAGHFVDYHKIQKIAESHNLFIIQDAAHAHGASINNNKVGDWQNIACFSFQNFKLMTAGEGGLLLFPSEELRETAFLYHNCGRPQNDKQYQHLVVGSNYRYSPFLAAILSQQLKRLPEQNALRHKNGLILADNISKISSVSMQQCRSEITTHPYYMAIFILDENINRDFVVAALNAEGIPAFNAYKPLYYLDSFLHDFADEDKSDITAMYKKACPVTDTIGSQGIWIHHRALLGNEQDIDDIIASFNKVLTSSHSELSVKKLETC